MNPEPRRRFPGASLAVGLISFVILHVASLPVLSYCHGRGWIDLGQQVLGAVYWPERIVMRTWPKGRVVVAYLHSIDWMFAAGVEDGIRDAGGLPPL